MEKSKHSAGRTLVYLLCAAGCVALAAALYLQVPALGKAITSLAFAGVVGAGLVVSLYFVMQRLQYNVTGKKLGVNVAFVGLMAALVFVGFFLTIRLPISAKAQIGFGNVFCVLSGLLLGPVFGGLAAGIGGFLYDLLSGWADSSVLTFVTKFIMAFVCGAVAWGMNGQRMRDSHKHLPRLVAAAVIGSASYSVLYLLSGYVQLVVLGNAAGALATIMATKAAATVFNGVLADVVAVPLFLVLHQALKRSHLAFAHTA